MSFNFKQKLITLTLAFLLAEYANAGQVPGPASVPDITICSHDRV